MQVWTEPSYQSHEIGAEHVRNDLIEKYSSKHPSVQKDKIIHIVCKHIYENMTFGSLRGYASFGPPLESIKKIENDIKKELSYILLSNKLLPLMVHHLHKPGGFMQKKTSERFKSMC